MKIAIIVFLIVSVLFALGASGFVVYDIIRERLKEREKNEAKEKKEEESKKEDEKTQNEQS